MQNKLLIASAFGYAGIVYAGLRTNFIPYGVNGFYVIAISGALGLGLLRFILPKRLITLSLANQRWLKFYLWLLTCIVWVGLVGVMPAFSTFISSEPYEGELTILSKRSGTIRNSCQQIVTKEYEGIFAGHLCTSTQAWSSLRPGQKIRVSGAKNRFGLRIDEISIPK